MIIIETFERGFMPRYRPSASPAVIKDGSDRPLSRLSSILKSSRDRPPAP